VLGGVCLPVGSALVLPSAPSDLPPRILWPVSLLLWCMMASLHFCGLIREASHRFSATSGSRASLRSLPRRSEETRSAIQRLASVHRRAIGCLSLYVVCLPACTRLVLSTAGSWAACGVAPLIDRERRVGCSMDSTCELLRSLDAASGSVHRCQVPCRTARSISTHQGGGAQRRVLLVFASLRRWASLREPARRTGGYGCMGRRAVHCCDSHLHCASATLLQR
jgi:hypothetical protein